MFEKISKKQEKVQKKVQKQQELNDKDCRELTDEELDQIVGGAKTEWTTVSVVHGKQSALGLTGAGKIVGEDED